MTPADAFTLDNVVKSLTLAQQSERDSERSYRNGNTEEDRDLANASFWTAHGLGRALAIIKMNFGSRAGVDAIAPVLSGAGLDATNSGGKPAPDKPTREEMAEELNKARACIRVLEGQLYSLKLSRL